MHPGISYPVRANPSLRYILYSLSKELLPETMCKAYVWGLCVAFLAMCGGYVWDRRCDIIYTQSSAQIPIDFLRIPTRLDYIFDAMLLFIPILPGRFTIIRCSYDHFKVSILRYNLLHVCADFYTGGECSYVVPIFLVVFIFIFPA